VEGGRSIFTLAQSKGAGVANWYPIKLTAHVRDYAFGARLIPDRLGKAGLPGGVVAETWEFSDWPGTVGTVVNGAFAGKTLYELVESYPDALVGEGWRGPHFPLLGKFLDASHMLPVHLHADDETAQRLHGQPNGKTEAWHVLWAKRGASILAGVKPEANAATMRAALEAENYDAVMPRYPVESGDTVYVPGGVLHSFGPGALIFEIQQTSDLAQSVMPVDLAGQPLSKKAWAANIDAALAELRRDYLPRPTRGLERWRGANRIVVGAAGPHFALERWVLTEPYHEPAHSNRCLTLTNLGDPVALAFSGGVETLARAESCIVPAALGAFRVVPDGIARLIACYVPDLALDIVTPLRESGYSDELIRTLGEIDSGLSPAQPTS